jgi:triosephosphate isomerase (TIM)
MMKRIPLIAGNWKMNKNIAEAREFTAALLPSIKDVQGVEKVLCPPFTALFPVAALLVGTDIQVGAQDMYWEAKGAYTGEVAPGMVSEFCHYVIIGHSERRTYFGETDESVNKKTKAATQAGLIPIVCVGETLAEYESSKTEEVVRRQLLEGLKGLDVVTASKIVVAYEPIWAIGTGRASSGENANKVVKDVIRPAIDNMYGSETAQSVRVLYGGSVTGGNAAEFFLQPEIDGALVGGASLKVEDFTAIVKAAVK